MKNFVVALAVMSCLGLTTVFAQPGATKQAGAAPDLPHFGLTADSYGPLEPVEIKKNVWGQVIRTSGDTYCQGGETVHALGLMAEANEANAVRAVQQGRITSRPDQGIDPLADRSLTSEGLEANFNLLSARVFWRDENVRGPTVAIVSRDPDSYEHIAFWRMPVWVKYPEVEKAAGEYCAKGGLKARLVGQSRRCAPAIPFSGPRRGAAGAALGGVINNQFGDDAKRMQQRVCKDIYGRDAPCPATAAAPGGRGTISATYVITKFQCEAAAEGATK